MALAKITALQSAFSTALRAALNGGTQLTAAKNAARDDLDLALRKTASYVQIAAGEDLPALLSPGFESENPNRSPAQLAAPVIVSVLTP